MELEPPFLLGAGAAFLPGAGVGSGTSDIRSRSRPKKWQLRNTGCLELYLVNYSMGGSIALYIVHYSMEFFQFLAASIVDPDLYWIRIQKLPGSVSV